MQNRRFLDNLKSASVFILVLINNTTRLRLLSLLRFSCLLFLFHLFAFIDQWLGRVTCLWWLTVESTNPMNEPKNPSRLEHSQWLYKEYLESIFVDTQRLLDSNSNYTHGNLSPISRSDEVIHGSEQIDKRGKSLFKQKNYLEAVEVLSEAIDLIKSKVKDVAKHVKTLDESLVGVLTLKQSEQDDKWEGWSAHWSNYW